jgi:hypothetical protein
MMLRWTDRFGRQDAAAAPADGVRLPGAATGEAGQPR